MGCRQRRSARRSQVVWESGALRPEQRCRATLSSWCGILFLAAASAGCNTSQASPSIPNTVTIAFPEGTGVSSDIGAGQVARSLAVEGLTLLAPDGRPT